MVVRATIRAIVHQMPYSDRIPNQIKALVGSEISEITEIEIFPDEVRPLVTPSQKIRTRMLEKRILDAPPSPQLSDVGLESPIESADDGEETVMETDSQSVRQARVELYLSEQHHEFTSLIDKNLKEVMQQKHLQDPSWRRLVVELAMARSSEEAAQKIVLLASKAQEYVYSYVPFIRSEKHTRKVLLEYENSALKLETAELLDQLDYDAKVMLLRQLMVDLGMRADAEEIVNFTRGSSVLEDTSMAEKLELLALVGVRLSFIGLRFFLPITRLLYTKFKENDLVLVNNKNFSKLLTVLVRALESLEERFNNQTPPPSSSDSYTLTETTG